MPSTLEGLLSDPTVEKIVICAAGVLLIATIVHFANRSFRSRISHPDTRYRAGKLTTFAGYLVSLLFVTTVFRDQLGHLTVALGITAAAVTLALQEVIASIARWVAIPVGRFYQVGNRVQLGGVMGDVIDIGILRTTVMECGDWVNADLYNGRIVRIANSNVFKEPVFNYSADFPFLWDEIAVPVKYGYDYRLAREILQQIAEDVVGQFTARAQIAWREAVKKYRIEDESVEPIVTLVATTTGWNSPSAMLLTISGDGRQKTNSLPASSMRLTRRTVVLPSHPPPYRSSRHRFSRYTRSLMNRTHILPSRKG